MFVTTFTINMDPNILGQFANISVPSTLAVAVGYEPDNWGLGAVNLLRHFKIDLHGFLIIGPQNVFENHFIPMFLK